MKNVIAAAVAAVVLVPSAASAAKFHGAFLGLNVGYTTGEIEYDYEDGTTGFGDFSEDSDIDGFEGGVFAGYRHQFLSGFNLGIEGGYQLSGADGSYSLSLGANNFAFAYEKENEFYLSLKPGFLVAEDTLAYGIIGYQRADFGGDLLINGVSFGSDEDDFDGYHVGVGIEHIMPSGLSLRGEYKYQDYGDNDYSGTFGQQESYGGSESVFRVGVAFNLNAGTAQ